jgi:hypothetical protein
MIARRFQVTLTGETPLLMHNDNLSWDEKMKKWLSDPDNKKNSSAGDDRTPAWRWQGYLYTEANKIVIPADNLMTLLREGGAKCPTGKGQLTFKRQTQSGLVVDQSSWPLLVNGNEVPMTEIKALAGDNDFEKHIAIAEKYGFELFVKRAKIGQAKHIRVRPRFDNWSCTGTITVLDETITEGILTKILSYAGIHAGLCDWRPSSPKSPGPFGKFTAEIKSM